MFDNMNKDFNNNFNNNTNNSFNNNIDSNFDSSNFGSGMNNGFNNNNLNNTMNNDFSNSFGNKPLFDNFNNQSSVNYNQEYSGGYNNEDIPPELDDIKPLNNTSLYEAPTLDVLGPANFMPENNEPLNSPNDPLSLYEKGNIDLNSNSNFNSGIDRNFDSSNFSSLNNFNNMNNNAINSNFENSYTPNNQSSLDNGFNPLSDFSSNANANSYNSFENFKNSYQLDNSASLNSDLGNDSSDTYDYQSKTVDNNIFNNNHESSLFENKLETDNSHASTDFRDYLSNSKNREVSKTDDISDQLTGEQREDNFSNDLDTEEKSYEIDNSSIDKPLSDKKDASDNNFDHGYEIENDISLEEKSSPDSLDDLGIDDSYNEPDTLEIMDLDEKDDKELKEDDADNVDEDLLSSSVDKIKKLINEIKTLGVNIEFEEFDFEQMYQLIIKINKNKED